MLLLLLLLLVVAECLPFFVSLDFFRVVVTASTLVPWFFILVSLLFQDVISANIAEVKVHGPDYASVESKDEAARDFLLRLDHYEEQYVPMCEENEAHLSYIKVINAGEKLVINRHHGNLQSKVGYWLMNLHITPRSIYLTRHGESEYNLEGRLGGDSGLSARGRRYAELLGEHINQMRLEHIQVWTSELRRTVQTAACIKGPQVRWKALNELV